MILTGWMSVQSHGPLAMLVMQILVIVGASRLVAVGMRAFGQPAVIAEIAAGILLGPTFLGRFFPGVSAALFPASSLGALAVVSQLGLLLFLFVVGLNFDTGLLSERGRAAALISNVSVIAPFALGFTLAIKLFPTLAPPGVPFATFALFMGVAMSITAFPVLARILVDRDLMQTKIGAISLACAAADDVTGWCILAFVVAAARSAGAWNAIGTAGLAAGFTLLMLLVVRPILRKMAEERRDTGTSPLALTTAALTFALCAGLATELIGIHALFGAFLAGCVVPRTNDWAANTAAKLESVVVALLLPLFFAYSGLRTHIGLLDRPEDWALCLVIVLAAVAGKFGGGAVAARLSGMPSREALAIGVLMNTRGLMELVVLNIGLDLGVVSEKLFAMMIVMALVTTAATTPLLEWLYPRALLAPGADYPNPKKEPFRAV